MEARPPIEEEGPLLRELRWVHGHIRRDLATVRELAARVTEGEEAAAIREGIEDLKTGGPLWRLRFNCLNYCRFVHTHQTTSRTPPSFLPCERRTRR